MSPFYTLIVTLHVSPLWVYVIYSFTGHWPSGWVFTNGLGELDSIPGRVMPKTQKMVLDASLLNTQHYKVRIKGKVKQSREGVAPSPTPQCSSYRKRSFRVTLDYGRQLYFLLTIYSVCVCVCVYIYIYIYIYI